MQNKINVPFYTLFDYKTNILNGYDIYDEKKLSQMDGYFFDETTLKEMISENDRIVYRVYRKSVPSLTGELLHCVTIIEPGNVGKEFFMTRGHYHKDIDTAEIYFGLKGNGLLIMQKENESKTFDIKPGLAAYIPSDWGHRTINISTEEPFVFLSVWPAQSGYDYERSIREPFSNRIFKDGFSYILK